MDDPSAALPPPAAPHWPRLQRPLGGPEALHGPPTTASPIETLAPAAPDVAVLNNTRTLSGTWNLIFRLQAKGRRRFHPFLLLHRLKDPVTASDASATATQAATCSIIAAVSVSVLFARTSHPQLPAPAQSSVRSTRLCRRRLQVSSPSRLVFVKSADSWGPWAASAAMPRGCATASLIHRCELAHPQSPRARP